jgi:hypothetical protein
MTPGVLMATGVVYGLPTVAVRYLSLNHTDLHIKVVLGEEEEPSPVNLKASSTSIAGSVRDIIVSDWSAS